MPLYTKNSLLRKHKQLCLLLVDTNLLSPHFIRFKFQAEGSINPLIMSVTHVYYRYVFIRTNICTLIGTFRAISRNNKAGALCDYFVGIVGPLIAESLSNEP